MPAQKLFSVRFKLQILNRPHTEQAKVQTLSFKKLYFMASFMKTPCAYLTPAHSSSQDSFFFQPTGFQSLLGSLLPKWLVAQSF